ncbi:hypothetical protein HF1_06680 [Mycoplasma haemofelis str. Langford 1]|uniref:Uncharacterized protein n=1 Tax=Mycoplasma haemofelis (strain Langford 1) TaxID=941640 RepID=E8ZHQ5_MYCHL|nr:hypothetical protein [Mycoplasma haemofelis]CBY92676.1 hypothetical protein HF1_06680 [Mycoplasma haemofelis str. Langford 1]
MSFNSLKFIAPLSGMGLSGALGTWYFYPKGQEPVQSKFKDVFRYALLTTSDEIWNSKLSKLQSSNIHGVHEKLSKAKSANGKQELQEACNSIYELEFFSRESDEYKNFKDFCSLSNKDKLPKDQFIGEDDSSLTKQVQAISKDQGPFSYEFQLEVKDKITGDNANQENKDPLKNWCSKYESEPYMQDLISTEFETYCKKKS